MVESKKRVLFISPSTAVKGGISTVIKGYLNSKLSDKYRIFIVSSHHDGNKFLKAFMALSGIVKTFFYMLFKRIDIVHIHGSDTTSSLRKYLYFKIIEKFSCKTIYHFHGASFLELYHSKSSIWQEKIKYLFDHATKVICLSTDWEKKINKLFPQSKTIVIENAVNLPKEYKYEVKKNDGILSLLFLGLIGDRKGIFDLLDVVKKLKDSDYKIRLYIGGNGEIGRLKNKISDLNLDDTVEYLGWVDAEEKNSLLKTCDIFILPSYGEGMPMSILEAMSYGLPIISTKIGGIPELIIDNETGFLIDPGDQVALFQSIKALIQNDKLRAEMGLNSRNLIENKYNLATNILRLDTIYQELLSI